MRLPALIYGLIDRCLGVASPRPWSRTAVIAGACDSRDRHGRCQNEDHSGNSLQAPISGRRLASRASDPLIVAFAGWVALRRPNRQSADSSRPLVAEGVDRLWIFCRLALAAVGAGRQGACRAPFFVNLAPSVGFGVRTPGISTELEAACAPRVDPCPIQSGAPFRGRLRQPRRWPRTSDTRS